MANIIELEELHKIYNENKPNACEALKGVNMTVEEGESIAIMGISGSGKSTLLHIIGCMDTATSGKCVIDGRDATKLSLSAAADMRNAVIGFVLQEYALLLSESVYNNIKLPLLFSSKYPYKEIKQRVNDVAESLGIKELLKKKVRDLSGGQKQRVAIARAIVNDPKILLADEPTGALDSITAREIMEVLLKLNKEGITLIVVTHDKAVADLMGRTLYIKDGLFSEEM